MSTRETMPQTARAAASVALLATEAAGVALSSAASDRSVILAGKAVVAISRLQRRLVDRYGVVEAAWLLRGLLERECDVIIARTDDELLNEISLWGLEEEGPA